jgi:transposase InsO family protein
MVVALADHDRRHNSDENSKSLKFGKKDKTSKNKPFNNKDKEKSSESSGPCEHCKSRTHTKKKCYFLHPDLRPNGWEPYEGKKHLMKENLGKSAEKGSSSGVKIVRSMKVSSINKITMNPDRDDTWWIDSGADNHVCYDKELFEAGSYKKLSNTHIHTANNEQIPIVGKGTVLLDTIVDGEQSQIRLTGVYHCPRLEYNLLSVSIVEAKGYTIRIQDAKFEFIHPEDDVSLSGSRATGGGYYVDTPENDSKVLKSSRAYHNDKASWRQWHRRLAHLGMKDVKRLAGMSTGIDVEAANSLQKQESPKEICDSYAKGKQHRNNIRIPHTRATKKGELVHCDLAGGGLLPITKGGARYVAAMTDDFTDFTIVYLLKRKSDLKEVLRNYLNYMKTQRAPVQRFRSDNEGEFAGNKTINLLEEFGVKWEPTAPYNPGQNEVAERCFRTLFGRARAILVDSKLPPSL